MDYKSKYIKYKNKYIKLLNKSGFNNGIENYGKLFGGSETIVPSSLPETYSFLFMPLIYYTIDSSSVTMIDEFESIINECINNSKELIGDSIPFEDFASFITYFKFALNTNGINTLEDIEKLKDGDHHIPGDTQENVSNYNSDESINMIISCLANMLVERYPGKKFIYNK